VANGPSSVPKRRLVVCNLGDMLTSVTIAANHEREFIRFYKILIAVNRSTPPLRSLSHWDDAIGCRSRQGDAISMRERNMFRKSIIGLAAVAAFGAAFVSSEASARGGHGGGHGGGFHGGGFHGGFHGGGFRGGSFHGANFGRFNGFRHHGFRGRFFAPGFAFYGVPYAYSYDDYDDFGCYRPVRVRTPYGYRWRQVYVCY